MPSKRLLPIACCGFSCRVVCRAGTRKSRLQPLDDIGGAAKDTFTQLPPSCVAAGSRSRLLPAHRLSHRVLRADAPGAGASATPAGGIDTSFSHAQKKLAGYWGQACRPTSTLRWLGGPRPIHSRALARSCRDISSASSDVGGVLQLVSCACKVAEWKNPGELAGDFGACVSDALCAAAGPVARQHLRRFASCSSTPPPPPQLIDCRVIPAPPEYTIAVRIPRGSRAGMP